MSFNEQLIASAIGAFLGFSFSLFLFWLQKKYEEKNLEKSLIRNLCFEVQCNITFLDKCSEEIDEIMQAVASDSRSINLKLDYGFIGMYHSKVFYNHGLISKYFHPENIRRWNIFLHELSPGSSTYIRDEINKWCSNEIEKGDVHDSLKLEKKHIQYGLEMCHHILDTLNNRTKH